MKSEEKKHGRSEIKIRSSISSLNVQALFQSQKQLVLETSFSAII